jgi:hypothetical protein
MLGLHNFGRHCARAFVRSTKARDRVVGATTRFQGNLPLGPERSIFSRRSLVKYFEHMLGKLCDSLRLIGPGRCGEHISFEFLTA